MATYKEVQALVKQKYRFQPKTCWIADVKASFGLTTRQAPNRISSSSREAPCPPEKRAAIEAALRELGMI